MKYILFDHDGVLVDTEPWYFEAGERALADIGFVVDKDQYLLDMSQGLGTWAQAKAAGVDGVIEVLAELSPYVRMAIVTTAKRADFELIHLERQITSYMDFVLVREDYTLAKPHPEP